MKFASIVALALPAVALAQSLTTSTISATPTPTGPPDLTVCEEAAGSYADACPQCAPKCATSSAYAQCIYSVFSTVNYIQSQCWQHGGNNCRERALAQVCG
ncbi:hypothetical protein GGS23DRAFT_444548 [Durotheca rogersii]|uniref:uncharacterized protein n=1 Tax=Durotheca rogersii TaxID=419775 RepID=UPI00221EC390|nr:uncharacterized protein GGS23DRAFT_444548 [Durotheca rogersii]KAI5855555.1 hypothetical protein GGS23DRAFT_444548 [Durotheca rogersii]